MNAEPSSRVSPVYGFPIANYHAGAAFQTGFVGYIQSVHLLAETVAIGRTGSDAEVLLALLADFLIQQNMRLNVIVKTRDLPQVVDVDHKIPLPIL
jgi:hypothetical protein